MYGLCIMVFGLMLQINYLLAFIAKERKVYYYSFQPFPYQFSEYSFLLFQRNESLHSCIPKRPMSHFTKLKWRKKQKRKKACHAPELLLMLGLQTSLNTPQ